MTFLDVFFAKPESNRQRIFVWSFLAVLFLSGVIHWLAFYNYGSFLPNMGNDWMRGNAYYAVFKQAISAGQIPWTATYPGMFTDKFLAVPETVWSPQILALSFLSIPHFITANTLFMFTIGFIGCLWIRKRFSLSLFSFTVLFLLFNFNGHITHHLAIGQSMWLGYYLLPFFCVLVMDLVEKPSSAIEVWLSLILFAIFLQGSFHIMVWCLMFLALIAVFNREHWKPVLRIVLSTFVLSSVRLIPGLLFMPHQTSFRVFGFSSLWEIFNGMVVLHGTRDVIVGTQMDLGQYDMFIDIIGLGFLAFFGVYKSIGTGKTFRSFAGPMVAMMLLSMTAVYSLIYSLPILNAERMVARFILIPVLFLMVFAVRNLEAVLSRVRFSTIVKIVALVAAFLLRAALITHSDLWSAGIMSPSSTYEFPSLASVASVGFSQAPFSLYALSVKAGLCISILFFAKRIVDLLDWQFKKMDGKIIKEGV